MLPLSFAFVLLLIIGTHGAPQDTRFGRPLSVDNSLVSGQLRVSKDGQTEELIPIFENEKTTMKTSFGNGVQQLPSPCTGSRPMTKLAHPTDKTKYIQCRDQFHYEVFFCPNHGEFDEFARTCVTAEVVPNVCEDERPCLNGGECIRANSTFKCNCGSDWNGDRCETPAHICATKPCGQNAECRQLKVSDYKQEYICLCKGRKEYGPNCLETVPNPCSTDSDQFFPFAFSPRLYIQCDGESMFFQPCGPSLFWNQDEKFCDRKRPTNVEKKTGNRRGSVKQETTTPEMKKESFVSNDFEFDMETSTIFTKVPTADANTFENVRNPAESDQGFSFVPTLVTAPNSITRETVFAVNSQAGKTEILVNQPNMNKFQTSVLSEPTQSRFKQWQTGRAETIPVSNNVVRPTVSQNFQPTMRREGLSNEFNRPDFSQMDQVTNNKRVMMTDEQKFGSEVQSMSPTGTQAQPNSMMSSSMMSSGMRTQTFQPTNQISRQELSRTAGSVRVQPVATSVENMEVEKTPMTNSQESQRFSGDMKGNKLVETQFVAGFAPSMRDRENSPRREEQVQSKRFQPLNSNLGLPETESRTFGSRAFVDNSMDKPISNFIQVSTPETTTIINRFPVDIEMINSKPLSNQQKVQFNFNTQTRLNEQPQFRNEQPQFRNEQPQFRNEQPQFRNEQPQFRNEQPLSRTEQPQFQHEEQFRSEELRTSSTTMMTPVDTNNEQFQTFSQPQRLPIQPSSNNVGMTNTMNIIRPAATQTNPPLTWEEIIRLNKPTKPSSTTTTTLAPNNVNEDEHETVGQENVGTSQDFQRVVSGSEQGIQRFQSAPSNVFESSTIQQVTMRPQGFQISNVRDQDKTQISDFTFPQRPSSSVSMGGNQFSENQNRQPIEDIRFAAPIRSQQTNPTGDLSMTQQSESSMSNGRFNNNNGRSMMASSFRSRF